MWRFLNKLIANFHLSISSVFEYIKLFSQYIKLFIHVRHIIIYMKKLLDSDWLRAVQFRCNTSAKSVTPVQKV